MNLLKPLDREIKDVATKYLTRNQVLKTFASMFAGRRSNNGAPYHPQQGGGNALAKHVVGRLSRRLNIIGLLLFAFVTSLLSVGAGAQEPPAPSSVSVWYAAGTSLVRVDAQSGQAAGSVQLTSQTSPVSSLASHPADGSVAVLAKGRLLGFDGSGTKTFEVPVAAASALGTAPVLASDPHVRRLGVVPDALLPPYRERVVGDE